MIDALIVITCVEAFLMWLLDIAELLNLETALVAVFLCGLMSVWMCSKMRRD